MTIPKPTIAYVQNPRSRKKISGKASTKAFSLSVITQSVMKFHKSFPEYEPTLLVSLTNLSRELGIADIFVACSDEVTMKGMWVLGNPLQGDDKIISGESGAVTLGLVIYALKDRAFQELSSVLGLNSESRVWLISTEGDTDPDMYRKVVQGYCSR